MTKQTKKAHRVASHQSFATVVVSEITKRPSRRKRSTSKQSQIPSARSSASFLTSLWRTCSCACPPAARRQQPPQHAGNDSTLRLGALVCRREQLQLQRGRLETRGVCSYRMPCVYVYLCICMYVLHVWCCLGKRNDYKECMSPPQTVLTLVMLSTLTDRVFNRTRHERFHPIAWCACVWVYVCGRVMMTYTPSSLRVNRWRELFRGVTPSCLITSSKLRCALYYVYIFYRMCMWPTNMLMTEIIPVRQRNAFLNVEINQCNF